MLIFIDLIYSLLMIYKLTKIKPKKEIIENYTKALYWKHVNSNWKKNVMDLSDNPI